MTSSAPPFDPNPAILGAFVQAVAGAGDSPTVIRRVAANAAFVDLCRRIVRLDPAADMPPLLEEACRQADITAARLLARLGPVARALRLVPDDSDAYYRLLGVAPDSDADRIRRAFRRRARDLHPDLQPEAPDTTAAFTALTTAYQTLSDPAAKKAYDARRAPDGNWFEPDPQQPAARRRRARFTAVVVAVLLLVAAALVLDQLYREKARLGAYRTARTIVSRPVAPPAPLPATPRGITPPPQRTAATRAQASCPMTFENTLAHELAAVPAPLEPRPASCENGDPAPETETVAAEVSDPERERKPATAARAAVTAPGTASEPVPAPQGPAAEEPPPAAARVAIFYAHDADAALAAKLADALADRNFPAPRVAREPSERPSNIRYFHRADRAAARRLQDTVRGFLARTAGPAGTPVSLKDLSRRYPRDDRGLMEVWINTQPGRAKAAIRTAATQTPPPDAVPVADPLPENAVEDRIQAFLDTYCRTYETLDPDRLAHLFETTATENGAPFRDLLPRYQANMARMARLSYHIDMAGWAAGPEAATLAVRGRFKAEGALTDQKHYRSQGSITLEIVPHGETFKVARLAYCVDSGAGGPGPEIK